MSLHRFAEVSPAQPCACCKKTSWCSRLVGAGVAYCRRVAPQGGKEKRDKNGAPYWVFREDGVPVRRDQVVSLPASRPRGDDLALHLVYSAVLDCLRLEDRHRENLRQRGLPDEEIDRLGYRSSPRAERTQIARELIEKFGEERCAQVPGLIQKKGDGGSLYWTLAGGSGIVIPVRNQDGQIVALKLRSDNEEGPRYYYLSSSRHGGPSPGSPLHYPLGADFGNASVLRATEGELKADIATALSATPTIGLPGVSHAARVLSRLTELTAKQGVLLLSFDKDFRDNRHVAAALLRIVEEALDKRSIQVGLEHWDESCGKGIDDVLAAGHEPKVVYDTEALRLVREALSKLVGPSLDDRIRGFQRFPNEPWPEVRDRLRVTGLLEAIARDPSARDYRTALLQKVLGQDIRKRDLNRAISDAAEELDEDQDTGSASTTGSGGNSAADALIEIGQEGELVHDERSEPFAILEVGETRKVMALRGQEYQELLIHLLWKREKRAPSSTAIDTAVRALSAQAVHDGEKRSIHLRVVRSGDTVLYDLADEHWRGVEIRPKGWKVIARPDTLFRRYPQTAPQLEPQRGSSLEELRAILAIDEAFSWYLIAAWIIGSLLPGSERPALVLVGDHDTGKSLRTRIIRRLVDPSSSELLAPPESIHDLYQSASQSYVLALENLSSLDKRFSDALCRICTGVGFEKKKLYSDEGVILWKMTRPVIMNGIGHFVTASDLLDRSLVIPLQRLPESRRVGTSELLQRFENSLPGILGATLDAVSACLGLLPKIKAPGRFRMVDFVAIGLAVEKALGWPEGAFLSAMEANHRLKAERAVEDCPVASALSDFALRHPEQAWKGTATELRTALIRAQDVEASDLPKVAEFGRRLTAAIPHLATLGVSVRRERAGKSGKRILIVGMQQTKLLSALSASPPSGEIAPDDPALRELLGEDLTDREEDSP